MSFYDTYTFYAVLSEFNAREFRKKLNLFPEELRYYVILANSIIGAENAKRVQETPPAIVEESRMFVEKLLATVGSGEYETFRKVLETYLFETLKDELRYSCQNCTRFGICIGLAKLSIGELFERRVNGEDTEELKREISMQIDEAMKNAPHIDTDRADELCELFVHQYTASGLGEVAGRYLSIAQELQSSFGLDYRKFQQNMIEINLKFCAKGKQ